MEPKLSKTHWERKRRDELAMLAELTGLSADEIDASMSAPDSIDAIECDYCRKARPRAEMKQVRIYCNRRWELMWFCADAHCSGNMQMACEG
jgi:hypothetical protein